MQRILIIEDDEKLREELQKFLNNNGYKVEVLKTFDNTLNDILSINPFHATLENATRSSGMPMRFQVKTQMN